MNRKSKGFTLIELLVVVAIIGALIAILVPTLSKVRKRAKTLICTTNVRGLTQLYRMAVQQNGNLITSGGHGGAGAWDYQLIGTQMPNPDVATYYSKNGKASALDKFRFCPETSSDRTGGRRTGSSFEGWECNFGAGGGSAGAYEINGWTIPSNNAADEPYAYNLKRLSNENIVPVFADGVWHDFKARDTDPAPRNPNAPSTALEGNPGRGISDVVVNRHDKKTNVAFWDGRAETVPLEQIWSIKWNKKWVDQPAPKLDYKNY